MPDTSEMSKFVKPENVKDGDTITFLDAGVIIKKSFKEGEEKKPVLEITVKFKDEDKTYSPNKTTVKLLSAAWGTATEKWVGKRAVLAVLPSSSGKDMIIAKPLDDKKTQRYSTEAAGDESQVPF